MIKEFAKNINAKKKILLVETGCTPRRIVESIDIEERSQTTLLACVDPGDKGVDVLFPNKKNT